MWLRTRTGSKPMTIARLHEFDHIDPALAALDAGDRRLRLTDKQCNLMQCL